MISQWIKRFPGAEKLARKLVSLYPYSARLGTGFWSWYAFLQESESWTEAQIREFQFERLQDLLLNLAATSPFYARRLAGVPIKDIQSTADLDRWVPPLTRREFRDNFA
ncbi:MAG TPA: hypothetical protein VEC99_12125, partial [Clostridia bacterium]|nr:hypothetical protein [Clostridia bacterium]